MTYPPGHEWFYTSRCGAVSITKARDGWHVWLFAWKLPEVFRDEVQAVIKLQKMTRSTQNNR